MKQNHSIRNSDQRDRKRSRKRPNRNVNGKRPKEVELNIDRKDLNKADLEYSRENDLAWYARHMELLTGACNFTYPLTLGQDMHNLDNFTVANFSAGRTIPGLATLYFSPTMGYCSSPTDAPNDAARTQFTFQRYSNSRNATYEAPDLMLSYICCDSAAMFISMLKKVYGVIKNNPYQNAYYPLAIIESMGISYSDVINNLAQFRTDINTLCYRFNRLAIPADVYYFVRHQWMVAGLYLDSDTSMAQTYHFHPIQFYQWNEGTEEGANTASLVSPYPTGSLVNGGLATGNSSAPRLTAAELISFGNSLLDKLLASETVIQNISGDILKAYGSDNLLFLPPIDELFTIVPSFSEEVLSEIENARFLEATPAATFNITQSTDIGSGHLICTPSVSRTMSKSSSILDDSCVLGIIESSARQILNMHKQSVTPGDNMIATRFMYSSSDLTIEPAGAGMGVNVSATLSGIGSEIMTSMHITGINPTVISSTQYANLIRRFVPTRFVMNKSQDTNVNDRFAAFIMLQQFDWHPYAAMYNIPTFTAEDGKLNIAEYYGDTRDIDNYTIISNANIRQAHNVALLSMFDSPKAYQLSTQPYRK